MGVIVVGVCVGPSGRFETIAQPSLAKHAPDAKVVALRDQRSIAAAYNTVLETAAEVDDLEAVVLLHDDVEVADPDWAAKLRAAFADGADVVGVIGGSGSGGMAWFTRVEQHGAVREPSKVYDFGNRAATVEVVDGLFIALSAAASRALRFDEATYPPFHGYDSDICSRARAAGLRVALAPIDLVHHTRGAFGSTASYTDWIRASIAWRLAWRPMSSAARVAWRVRHRLVPLEVRLRPSTRARRRNLVARSRPTVAGGAA